MSLEVARTLDASLLHPTLTDQQICDGCEEAKRLGVASVCVKPYAVALAAEILAGSDVAVGTVIGFPHGANATEVKAYEAKLACAHGATELDMVVNIGQVVAGDWDYVENDIQAVVDVAHANNAITKVIFENDLLPNDGLKIELCKICERVGAEFVKTSTGFGFVRQTSGDYNYRGATEHDVQLMREHCGPQVGVKAAGGVRTHEEALKMIQLGATRIGTSAPEALIGETGKDAAAGY